MTIAVIGATGKLGRALMQYTGTIACPIRFEEADKYKGWFEKNAEVDTVWHVARACRNYGVRRDHKTFLLEHTAMNKLLESRASACRFVYASTKVVYGHTSNESTPLSSNTIAGCFLDDLIGFSNCPEWKSDTRVNIDNLKSEHLVYAMTKLACERLISDKCPNYKILRIWDII